MSRILQETKYLEELCVEDSTVPAFAPTLPRLLESLVNEVDDAEDGGLRVLYYATTVGTNVVRRAGSGLESIVGISARTVTSCHELAVLATISNPALSAKVSRSGGVTEKGDRPELTRDEVAERLGVHKSTVRRLEGKALHPVRRGRRFVFDAKEVEALEARQTTQSPSEDGEMAARAFELFEAGKTFRQVVIALRITPDRVKGLYRSYAFDGDLVVPADMKRQIEQMGFGGEGYTLRAEDLPRFLQNLTGMIAKQRRREESWKCGSPMLNLGSRRHADEGRNPSRATSLPDPSPSLGRPSCRFGPHAGG
jgi:excisionase family DNA binding protein